MKEELYGNKEEIVKAIWQAKAVNLREVPLKVTNDEVKNLPLENQPFLYASGNWGMGYVSIKGLVSFSRLFNSMVRKVKETLERNGAEFDFVAGLMTGGVTPGYQLSQLFKVPFMYLEGTRKKETISAYIVDQEVMEEACQSIVGEVIDNNDPKINFVAGVAPKGMVPGLRISQLLSEELKRDIPFVYIRAKKKAGGLGELITGKDNNPNIFKGSSAIAIGGEGKKEFAEEALKEAGFKASAYYDITDLGIEVPFSRDNAFISHRSKGLPVEELVNFAGSTGNAALWLRDYDFIVENVATILTYENPEAIERLRKIGVEHNYFMTLPELLEIGERTKSAEPHLIQEYRRFLEDPLKWQAERGLIPIEKGGTI